MKLINEGLTKSGPDFLKASVGISRPDVATLVESNSRDWANGPWWVREDDYRKIIARFQTSELSLGTTARSALAVQPSWSLMDVSIKARVIHDMNVFVGSGSTQYHDVLPNGMKMTLPGWPDIQQVYIPNMRSVGRANLEIMRQKIIQSHAFGWR